MDFKVVLSGQADRDLEKIVRFLAEKNAVAAERLGHALIDDALSLARFPNRGHPVRAHPGYRRLVHGPCFLIFYRVDESQRVVKIARIWDARQDSGSFKVD